MLFRSTIPAGVTHIGNGAFGDDRFLCTVNFEGDLEAVCLAGDDYAEGWTGMERVFAVFNGTPWLESYIQENYLHGECGEGITWRLVDNEDGVFVYNETGEIVPDPDAENEEDIHFERRLTLIIEGDGAMDDYVYDFDNYENCVFQPWNFFSNMITRIQVCEGITHIGDNAFRWFDNLKAVSLPDTLLSIGAFAFENCMHGVGEDDEWTPVYGLTEITIPAGVTYIGEEAFANNNFLAKVDAKCDLEAVCLAGDDFWEGIHPAGRVMDVFHDSPWFWNWIEENYMRGTCGENVTWYLEDTGEGVWVYAETGQAVEDPADFGTDGTFYADFYRLVITGTGAMDDYENGIPPLDYYGINVRSIIIESGVTAIGENAFVNCPELLRVSLPLTLTRVGENAFSACPHLESVVYEDPGDADDWAAITIENGNEPLLNAEITLHTHTPGAAKTENEVPAACTAAGSYDTVTYCTACGKELTRETVPTDPLGHDYGEVTYEWAADNSVCTAKKVCRRDSAHVWQEASDKPVIERTEPTCTEAGKIVYTASFNNKSLAAQIKTVILPALGHDYVDHAAKAPTCAEVGWAAYQTCSRCDYTSYVEIPATGEHTWDGGKVTKEPTVDEPGEKTFTCTVCGQTKTEEIPKPEQPEAPVINGDKAREKNGNVLAAEGLTAGELLALAGKGATLAKADGKAVGPDEAVGTGMVLTKADGTKLPVIVKGDNDGNGKVETSDARLALRRAIGLEKYPEGSCEFIACDVDESSDVGTDDARFILRRAIGLKDPEINW